MNDVKQEQRDFCGTGITKQLLKTESGQFDLESIHILKLRNFDIEDLESIGECIGLERLDLSKNDISNLQALTSFKQLCFLNLSANRITNIEPLKDLESQQTLNVAGNLIGSFRSLHCVTQLDLLDSLRLCDTSEGLTNPVCNSLSYTATMQEMFPHLKTLDGQRISGKGSELFDLFRELDATIEQGIQHKPTNCWSSASWVSSEFWEHGDKMDSGVDLQQAETNFNEVLQECRKLNALATRSLAANPKS